MPASAVEHMLEPPVPLVPPVVPLVPPVVPLVPPVVPLVPPVDAPPPPVAVVPPVAPVVPPEDASGPLPLLLLLLEQAYSANESSALDTVTIPRFAILRAIDNLQKT